MESVITPVSEAFSVSSSHTVDENGNDCERPNADKKLLGDQYPIPEVIFISKHI
jgi:hypothetical protein